MWNVCAKNTLYARIYIPCIQLVKKFKTNFPTRLYRVQNQKLEVIHDVIFI